MRGTGYAIVEIVWWLLVATAIGFAVGWMLRKWFLGGQLEEEYARLRDDTDEQRHTLRLELEDWKGKAAGFSTDLDSQTTELGQRLADLERANAQVADHQKSFTGMEASLKALRSDTMKLEDQIVDRESTIASLRSSETSVAAMAELQRALDGANGTVGSLRRDTEGYQATIASLRMDLDKINHDNAILADRLETSSGEAATITASLAASRGNEEDLRTQLAALETGAANVTDYQTELAELKARLAATTQERDLISARLGDVEASHADCEARSAKATTTATPAQLATADLPGREVAVAKVVEIATRTRGAGPAVDDDLKKIHGVGPKLDKLLKSMDITGFRQVASFTSDDIQYVTAALDAFPGRIERDDWMSSAAEEHSKKYGEPV